MMIRILFELLISVKKEYEEVPNKPWPISLSSITLSSIKAWLSQLMKFAHVLKAETEAKLNGFRGRIYSPRPRELGPCPPSEL
ncbi:unnamed protein product [Ambrosiozyma monospora]|uniref:Unnamed protein product n=1 Tax=Ambrosiozyma monospora TaxID=43982 RepID=A0ACB5T703_AMBMO|nr:unnamed protein product [Ambrosiozyma monospora]